MCIYSAVEIHVCCMSMNDVKNVLNNDNNNDDDDDDDDDNNNNNNNNNIINTKSIK